MTVQALLLLMGGGAGVLVVLAFLAGLHIAAERGMTPPPVTSPGTTYTCNCWLYPTRVTVVPLHGESEQPGPGC
ncbi:hypothetical protein ACFV5N_04255 [Streptomyces sp. NPDC059853]|uniref:hypothetical protein n=1 Tax=Streptomyces sp. NPDC059853 TaxID=3346973 RepID=UPI003647757B